MTSIKIKNVSDALHARLRQRARSNNRSLNRETIACLQSQMLPQPQDPDAFLREIATFRAEMKAGGVPALDDAFLAQAGNEGRE
ncbi:MAG: FitA-like ribbon-helix-helix domain-containing protein [Opitutales bacterium]